MRPDPQSVADAFGLGRAVSLSEPLARGELGQIRRLVTDTGTWAIKEALDDYEPDEVVALERTGSFHLACWEAGVPTPEPRQAAGRFLALVDGELLQAHSWVELADPDRSLDPEAVGALLASLHAVRRPPEGPVDEWFEAPLGLRAWRGVLKAARAADAPYADRLGDLVPSLVETESILTPVRPVQTCHLDLWSDNLRRTPHGGLCVFDFDNAGPGDPDRELAMVLFEFARGDGERARRLWTSYRDSGGTGRINGRADFGLTVAQLHHIGHRHLQLWPAARDPEARARALAGVEEFLDEPFLLADIDLILESFT